VRIDASNIDKPVWVQDPQPSVVELDNAIATKVAKHSIDMNACQTRRIPDVLLSQGKIHLLDTLTRPSHSGSNKEFKKQVGYALACGVTADTRQTIVRQASVARDNPSQLHSDFRLLSEQRVEVLIGDNAHDRIGQSLCTVGHHSAGHKGQHGSGKGKVKNLSASIFQQTVKRHPTVDESVNRVVPFAGPEQIATGLELPIARFETIELSEQFYRTIRGESVPGYRAGRSVLRNPLRKFESMRHVGNPNAGISRPGSVREPWTQC
jgi:hypothetical protein